MFVNYSMLKKMIKRAYEGDGITVACTHELVMIQSSRWGISVKRNFLHNKVKAALMEYIGDLPEVGEAWTYTKDGKNTERQQEIFESVGESFTFKPGDVYLATNVYVSTFQGTYQVYEGPDMNKVYVNSVFETLISAMNVEGGRGEIQPEGWRAGGGSYLFRANNVMTLYCHKYSGQTQLEVELLKFTKDTSFLGKDAFI